MRRTSFVLPVSIMLPSMVNFVRWSRYEAPADIFWDDQKYRGEAYAAFAWAVYVAGKSPSILTTYGVSLKKDFVALREVGRVLHPLLARGQIIGGVAQGIGFCLYEKVVWQNGRMQNGQMTNYIMPDFCRPRRPFAYFL